MPMSRRGRAGCIAALGAIAALIAFIFDRHNTSGDLALLATGVVLGELLVLRLEDRSAVPLSFAVMIVLASCFAADEYLIAVAGAELVAFFVVPRNNEPTPRFSILLARLLVAAATLLAYRGTSELLPKPHGKEEIQWVLAALGAAALAQLVTHTVLRLIARRGSGLTNRGRLAWLAVASSGMLMAVGYRGVDDEGGVGIWGPILFATPLLAAWYAFERLDSATLAYRQTIEALAMAPELGGLVPVGHSERVAALAVSMGDRLGLHAHDLNDLEMAALLHHVGQVTLDDPEVAGRPEPHLVAAVTSSMLREIKPLAGAGDIVAGESDDHRRRLAVQVLRLASEYDELTVVDGTPPDVAFETLRTAPRYIYDERVLNALERAVGESTSSAG
jgi:hypothetical protein